MDTYRRRRLVALACVGILIVAGIAGIVYVSVRPTPLTPAQLRARRQANELKTERKYVKKAEQLVNVVLPKSEGVPAPATPSPLFLRPLPSREVVGFVPYWSLPSFGQTSEAVTELSSSSVLVYSAVCVGASGALVATAGDCANGAADVAGPAFSNFVQLSHQAGDRVLLSVQTIDPVVIHALASHPSAHANVLWSAISHLVVTDHLDGVNLDIEGRSARDREGYVAFVGAFGDEMRAAVPSAELIVDTYPQSAASGSDFFDVARLSKVCDALFVMAYQMEQARRSSANSPLADPGLGWSAVQTLLQYRKHVASSRIIFGLPFYGLNFVTKTEKPGSRLVAASPSARLYLDIAAAAHPALWDVSSETPYTVFRHGGQWHQDWYDDPVSLALKSALAEVFHTAGVGVWAMSMEGNNPEMLNALLGGSRPIKLALTAVARG